MPNLKSSTALIVSFSLAAPNGLYAQGKEGGFPCIAPSGAVVENVNQLSRDLLAFLNVEETEEQKRKRKAEELAVCNQDAVDQAIEAGGDELAAALVAASDDRVAAVLDGAQASTAVSEGDEPVEKVEAGESDGNPAAEVAEQDLATSEADKPASAEGEVAVQKSDAETETTEEKLAAKLDADGDVAADVDTAAVEEQQSDASAEEAHVTPAGEAGGEQLTDAERQELAQARAADEPSAAAVAVDEEAGLEADVEVETQTVAEEDVRTSADDFDTSASGNDQAKAAEKDKGLSDFEKALLVGVGATIVGSILKNGDQVVSNSGDRVVVERDGELRVLKNDDVLLRRPGAELQTQTFNDGSTRTIISYDDGSQIITVRSPEGVVLRRTLIRALDGSEVVLFDDTETVEPVDFEELPEIAAVEQPAVGLDDEEALRLALRKSLLADVDRKFSLRQVRDYKRVRALAPQVELDALTFATGSAAIQPSQARALNKLGWAIRDIIDEDPGAVFLVEGHTDAVGSASYNLALSDRRAETVALALTEFFEVPPQNLITQGYGESDLKIPVLTDERANRRAAVRNITRLLASR